MKNEIKVISNDILQDIERYIQHCNAIIDKHMGLNIYLKNGMILKFCNKKNIFTNDIYINFNDIYSESLNMTSNYLSRTIKNEILYNTKMFYNALDEKNKEIEKLNNIINELEKNIINEIAIVQKCQIISYRTKECVEQYSPELKAYYWVLSRIKELKEGK